MTTQQSPKQQQDVAAARGRAWSVRGAEDVPKPLAKLSVDSIVYSGSLAVLALLIALPVAFLAYATVTTGSPGQAGATLTWENLRVVYGTTKYLPALANTLELAAFTTLVVTPIGALIAWLVARTDLPGKALTEVMLLIPLLISPLLGTLAWIALAAPGSGIINAWLGRGALHVDRDLVDIYSVPAIVFVMALYYIPNGYLFTVGALRSLDGTLEDAARATGIGSVNTFGRITLPLMGPALLSSALLTFVLAAELFAVPTLLGVRGNYQTIPLAMYMGFEYGRIPPGEVAALASLLIWITGIGMLLYRRMAGMARRYVTVTGKPLPPRPVQLGWWQKPAQALIWGYLVLAVIMPCIALVLGSLQRYMSPILRVRNFTSQNYTGLTDPDQLHAIGNTLILGIASSSICVVLGFLLATLVVRTGGLRSHLADQLSSLPIAIPGLAMAIGLLWCYAFLPLPVYGTTAILVIAYVTRFIGYSVRIGTAGLQQLDPDLEDAGRIAGLTRARTMWAITGPLMKPSAVSAWTLTFIFVVVEVTATILLYTPQSTTMSVVLWNTIETSGSTAAFAVGVAQVVVIVAALLVAKRIAGRFSVTLG